jgi:hypothetical protein
MVLVLLGAAVFASLWAQPSPKSNAKIFQGYWMGIDPLDGGDSRRSIVQQPNGEFAMVGRDTYFTLCDNTDRGLATFEDGVVVDRGVMASNNLKLACFNTGAVVNLKVKYVLMDENVMLEILTSQEGAPLDKIIFHRVSEE